MYGYQCVLGLLSVLSGIGPAREPITIYLAGDSTMAEKLPDKRPETGWGEALQKFVNPDKVRIENHAKNGRSTRTFIEEKLWQAILDKLKKATTSLSNSDTTTRRKTGRTVTPRQKTTAVTWSDSSPKFARERRFQYCSRR